jgi:hypothetical protein
MKFFVIALLFCLVAFLVGGIGLSFSDINIDQNEVSKTMTMSDIQNLAISE